MYAIISVDDYMKKIFVLLALCILCFCGCTKQDRYDSFEHYDLLDKDTTSTNYSFYNDNNQKETYIVTDITPENSEEVINGLFYKVGHNDYILIDSFSSCNDPGAYTGEKNNYFYNDKLYISRCSGGLMLEYTLNGAETTKKDLSSSQMRTYGAAITDIKDGYIYIEGIKKNKKCSQETYECTEIQ